MAVESIHTAGASAECARSNGAPSMSTLVSGIIGDAQQLIRDEMALARRELKEEIIKARTAAIFFAGAAGAGLLGAILFSFFLVTLLHWASGGTDTAAVPLWAWFLIWSFVFFVFGGGLGAFAYGRLKEIHLVPRQTMETMKENVQWIKNQK